LRTRDVTALACTSCSTISPAVRLPLKPIVPVAHIMFPCNNHTL
jgi:hypothetical protein